MKNNKYIVFLTVLIGLCCLTCKSKVIPEPTKRTIYVELIKGLSKDYISGNYSIYKPISIHRSNKTLNQYRVKLNLEDVWYKGMIKKLNVDTNVIKVTETDSSFESSKLSKLKLMETKPKTATK